jgi:hypothetical protein
MSIDFQNKIKNLFSEKVFQNTNLISFQNRKNATIICLIFHELAKEYFKDKNISISDYESTIINLNNENSNANQFKLALNISYDEIKITLKGIFIENSNRISLNIYFENKVTNEEELEHFDYELEEENEKESSVLENRISKLEKLFKDKFLNKYFKKEEPLKEPKAKMIKSETIPRPENPLIDPRSNPRGAYPPRMPYPNPNPGLFPNQPYPGLTPYIRYGRCNLFFNNIRPD